MVTHHPGLYERPEREPYLDFGALFKLLFHPKEAFEDLWDHTSATQGSILAIAFIVIVAILNIAGMFIIFGDQDLPDEATGLLGASTAVSSLVGMVANIFLFFIAAWMVHALLKGPGRAAHPDQDRTMGMMGYAKFPFFLIAIMLAFATPLMLGTIDFDELEQNPDAAGDMLGALCGLTALILGLSLVGFIWALWVHSHAQSVANDVSLGTAFGYTLLTWIIIFVIYITITTVVVLIILGTTTF
jgi:hypothetical protein